MNDRFYADLAPFTSFTDVLDDAHYRAIPDGWWVGVSDVVNSTGAIAEGRYKAVNLVGASVIAAALNALKGKAFPFVFGGDGAGLAVSGEDHGRVFDALAATRVWAAEEIGLQLRAALVPVADIRASGADLKVAKFSPSPGVTYAMFAGGGMAWAERQMKEGRFAVAEAKPGTRPDLSGLSCRYAPIPNARGEVVSLIALPRPGHAADFGTLVAEILALLGKARGEGRPVPAEGPPFAYSPRSLLFEARTAHDLPLPLAAARTFVRGGIAWVVAKTGWKIKGFDPDHYRRQTAVNTDFRKFDDGLKLTVDCDRETSGVLESLLERAHRDGTCFYGLHRQPDALMTCLVPSPFRDDHMHFVDGAGGGYVEAATRLKKQISASA